MPLTILFSSPFTNDFQSTFFTRASVGKPKSQNASILVAKRGVMVPGVPCIDHGNWERETRHCSLFVTECSVL